MCGLRAPSSACCPGCLLLGHACPCRQKRTCLHACTHVHTQALRWQAAGYTRGRLQRGEEERRAPITSVWLLLSWLGACVQVYVPFCALAVIEAMSDIESSVQDPFLHEVRNWG